MARRDRLVVRTLRCGRSNPGSNPGPGMSVLVYFFFPFALFVYICFSFSLVLIFLFFLSVLNHLKRMGCCCFFFFLKGIKRALFPVYYI